MSVRNSDLPSVIDLSDSETCDRLVERARRDVWVRLEDAIADGETPLDASIADEVEDFARALADGFMRQQSVAIPRELFRDLSVAKRARSRIRDAYLRAAARYIPWAMRKLRRDYRAYCAS